MDAGTTPAELFARAREKRQLAGSLIRLATTMGVAAHRALLNQHARRLDEEAFDLEVKAALGTRVVTTTVDCGTPIALGEPGTATGAEPAVV